MVESNELTILDFLEKNLYAEIKNLEKKIFEKRKALAKIERARLEIRSRKNDSNKQQRDRDS